MKVSISQAHMCVYPKGITRTRAQGPEHTEYPPKQNRVSQGFFKMGHNIQRLNATITCHNEDKLENATVMPQDTLVRSRCKPKTQLGTRHQNRSHMQIGWLRWPVHETVALQ